MKKFSYYIAISFVTVMIFTYIGFYVYTINKRKLYILLFLFFFTITIYVLTLTHIYLVLTVPLILISIFYYTLSTEVDIIRYRLGINYNQYHIPNYIIGNNPFQLEERFNIRQNIINHYRNNYVNYINDKIMLSNVFDQGYHILSDFNKNKRNIRNKVNQNNRQDDKIDFKFSTLVNNNQLLVRPVIAEQAKLSVEHINNNRDEHLNEIEGELNCENLEGVFQVFRFDKKTGVNNVNLSEEYINTHLPKLYANSTYSQFMHRLVFCGFPIYLNENFENSISLLHIEDRQIITSKILNINGVKYTYLLNPRLNICYKISLDLYNKKLMKLKLPEGCLFNLQNPDNYILKESDIDKPNYSNSKKFSYLFQMQFTKSDGPEHPHVIGALLRYEKSYYLYKYLSSQEKDIISVGENFARVASWAVKCHCINYIMDDYDYVRNKNYRINYCNSMIQGMLKSHEMYINTTYCYCGYDALQPCWHNLAINNYNHRVFVFIHSGYYIENKPENEAYYLVNLYSKNRQGLFNELDNYNEGTYYRFNDRIITKVNGNDDKYEHKDFSIFGYKFYKQEKYRTQYIKKRTYRDADRFLYYKIEFLYITKFKFNDELIIHQIPITEEQYYYGKIDNFFDELTDFYGSGMYLSNYNCLLDGSVQNYIYDNLIYRNTVNIDNIQYIKVNNVLITRSETNSVVNDMLIDYKHFANLKAYYDGMKNNKLNSDANFAADEALKINLFRHYSNYGKDYVETLYTLITNSTNNLINRPFWCLLNPLLIIGGTYYFMKKLLNNCFDSTLLYYNYTNDIIGAVLFIGSTKYTKLYNFENLVRNGLIIYDVLCYLKLLYFMAKTKTKLMIYFIITLSLIIYAMVSIIEPNNIINIYYLVYIFMMRNKFSISNTDLIIKIFVGMAILPFATCPFKPVRLINHCPKELVYFKIINNMLTFFNDKNEPELEIEFVGKIDTNMEGVNLNEFCNHKKSNCSTQICSMITGYEKENVAIPKCGCVKEQIIAQSRSLMKRATFDYDKLKEFMNFCTNNLLPYWFHCIDMYFEENALKFNSFTIFEWLQNYAPTQCKEYLVAYLRIHDQSFFDLTYAESHMKLDEIIREVVESKCRNIIAQSSAGKVLLGLVVYFGTIAIETYDKSFSSSRNFKDRAKELSIDIEKYNTPKELDIDGSGYDNTQHNEIKQIVDFPILNYIVEKMKHVFERSFYDLSLIYSLINQNVMSIVTKTVSQKTKFLYYFNYVKVGTVGSGFMNTSFGNTLRSISYIRFGLRYNTNPYDLYANGDDVKILSDLACIKIIRELLMDEVYVNDKNKNLGQIAKYIDIVDLNQSNFISTTTLSVFYFNRIYICRQFERIISGAFFSYKNNYENDDLVLFKNIELCISKAYEILYLNPNIKIFKKLFQLYTTCAKILCDQVKEDFVKISERVKKNMEYDIINRIRVNDEEHDPKLIELMNKEFNWLIFERYTVTADQIILTIDELIKRTQKNKNPYYVIRCDWMDRILNKYNYGINYLDIFEYCISPNTIDDNINNKNNYPSNNNKNLKLSKFLNQSLLKSIVKTQIFKLENCIDLKKVYDCPYSNKQYHSLDIIKVYKHYPLFDKFTFNLARNQILLRMILETAPQELSKYILSSNDLEFNYFMINNTVYLNRAITKFDLIEIANDLGTNGKKFTVSNVQNILNFICQHPKVNAGHLFNIILPIFNTKMEKKLFFNLSARLSCFDKEIIEFVDVERLFNITKLRNVIKDQVTKIINGYEIEEGEINTNEIKKFNKIFYKQ